MRVLIGQNGVLRPACATLWRRFVAEENGQDLVEYAFAAAFLGIVGYLALNGITSAVSSTYAAWLSPTSGVPSLWDPANPLTSGS